MLLRLLPTRALSRLWGRITWTELPVAMRAPVYMAWTRAFGCNLDEMAAASLDEFPSLGDFFVRALKDGVRPIAAANLVRGGAGRTGQMTHSPWTTQHLSSRPGQPGPSLSLCTGLASRRPCRALWAHRQPQC